MPLYEYKGYDSTGRGVSGVLDAPSRSEAFARLKARGLHPSFLAEDTGIITGHARIKKDELAFTLEQLSTLLHAGLPLTQAIESLTFQVESEGMKRALARTRSALQEGLSFPHALSESRAFPDLMIHLVESAEAVGALETILERYAEFLRTEAEFTRKLLASLTYPLIIMLACIGLLVFMLTYISPTLLEIFSTLEKTLPLTTRILMGTGLFLRGALPYIIVL
ncbi:MAG: type II secretion system F family protein, partial [Candidatus Eremiobacteraeota bacterium]|nr:type II secretion system F family protein [Candidatus Eremiobacteraeota bacterium]